ncbi:glycoside hydrolase family 18 protein, partial [Macroventuria anomochaeta]
VAYWGHTPGNRNSSILDLCKEPELDVVIAGWIVDFSLPGGFPRFDFGAGCMNMTPGKAAMNSSCGYRSKEMSSCQGLGKKVFIGIGGASSSITFTSRQDAADAADKLWSLFGNTTSPQVYQPFPDVSVDGFDLDHENGSPDYFDVFAQSLRQAFTRNQSQISLSTCVSCAFTDPVPEGLYQEVDFVSVRFYNAKSCN